MNRVISRTLLTLGISLNLLGSLALADETKPIVWTIAIGINRYDDASIPSCTGSIRDARAVAEWLSGTAGWGEGQILRMDDLGQRAHGQPQENLRNLRPTRANLDWAVIEWLGHRVRKNDVVLIYFAGQATARPPQLSSVAGRSYLLPIDAKDADVESTGWALDDALDKASELARRKARVVLWLDTSPFGRGQRGLPLEKGSPTGQDWLRALTRWPGVTAWLASDSRPAPDGMGGSPGPFVSSILEGMGTREQAHNLLGCLRALNDDPTLAKSGFQTMGGVGPSMSFWAGAARVVEELAPELVVQSGHGDRVTSVIVTADNSHAITASQDSTVRVWKLADRSLLRVLTDPIVGVEAMGLDRDGEVLIAGDGMGRIFGWDMRLDRPKPFYGPLEHTEGIQDVAFLPDGKLFVTRDRARRSVLWDGSQGAIKKLRAFALDPITHLATASRPDPTGTALAAAIEAEVGGAGSVALFDSAGKSTGKIAWNGARISALDLSREGRKIAVGDIRGNVAIINLPGGTVSYSGQCVGRIGFVRFSPSGRLVVSDSRSTSLIDPRNGGGSEVLTDKKGVKVPGEIERAVFSNDGRWLATTTAGGRVYAWQLDEKNRPEPIDVPQSDTQGLAPAFSPDSRSLFSGDADGGLRSWSLSDKSAVAKPRLSIAPSRGKVARLSPSASGRFLLEITRDDEALVWDLQEGRGCKKLVGQWTSGGFLPDESKLLLTTRPDEGGDVVLVDRVSGERLPTRFDRSPGRDGKALNTTFGKLVVSKTGKWVAASSTEGHEPLGCVWSVADGKLIHYTREHDGGMNDIDLSGDESLFLTASEDGTAKVWSMADPGIELWRPTVTLSNPAADAPAITSVRFCPTRPGQVVAGTAGGLVFYWIWDREKRDRVDLGRLDGSINATTFSNDGRWVMASSGREKAIRFWSIPEHGQPQAVPFRPRPNHAEQVGTLAAWPNGSMIVSGGDDSAVKFWDLNTRSLVGTLVAQAREANRLEWLAYSPEGLFDGSLPGEAMLKWRVGEKLITLQQSEDIHHVFQLAGSFSTAEKIPTPEIKVQSPELKIAEPGTDREVESRQVELILWTGETDPAALRLYQNGVPVKGPSDFERSDRPNFFKAKVTLRSGENSFYAMASKAGGLDGRSDLRTIRYNGVDPPGRVHTLAIGVSEYEKRPLRYAHSDAIALAQFLATRQINGRESPGERLVLSDKEVTLPNIENAFRKLRDAVKGRPQDTVVLFLAGHTDTDSRNDQFCLLLPEFRFEESPSIKGSIPETSVRVATRGSIAGGSFKTRVGDPGVLPYVVLYNRLVRLDALQRLIIVDACQAGAILDDPAVRNVQRLVEKGSRATRNSYILAARRGEPASEADVLKHGLLTYTLLRGMNAPGLEKIPDAMGSFPGPPTADRNGDGIVTTEELATYSDERLPQLCRIFPQILIRAANPAELRYPGKASVIDGPPQLEAKVRVQGSQTSFPLVKIIPE